MIDKITQNISPVTPLPGLLVENRPAAVNQLVEEELPLLSTQLETLVGQLNTTISQTNIAVDIAANAAVVSNSLSNYVGEWSDLVLYDKNQTTSIGTLYYISKVDNNLNHIVTDTNYWLPNPVNTKIDYNMSGYTGKTTPVDTDLLPLSDSAATFGIKKLTWANIKATLISSFGVMISTLTAKTTPVDSDIFTIGDSAATNASKQLTWANIKATLISSFGVMISTLTAKTTPVDSDIFTIGDSAATNASKKLTWANIKTALDATWVLNDTRAKTALNATGTAPIYACRAWVNFNGTGTVAIRASGNVSSITDNGVGLYTVNFITAMTDNGYSVVGSLINVETTATSVFNTDQSVLPSNTSVKVTSSFVNSSQNHTLADCSYVHMNVIR